MPTYTVHAPPPRQGETTSAPERFVFVRDGFHTWAFLLTPLWLLWRRLWLVVACYLVVAAALGVALYILDVSSVVKIFASALLSLLIGFEASTLWRWTLTRRGYRPLGFVVGDDRESAERRFFTSWVARAPEPSSPSTPTLPEPRYSAPLRRAAASDVIGLFPEPDAKS